MSEKKVGRPRKYPWGKIGVGQHFDVPATGVIEPFTKQDTAEHSLRACASHYIREWRPTARFDVLQISPTTIRCRRIA